MANTNQEFSAVHLLHRAGQCAGDIFSEEMGMEDLTPRQFVVLQTVSENEGLSQAGLVDRTGIDRSTMADIIRRMLKKGLLKRQRAKNDNRAYALKLTEQGWQSLKAAEPAAIDADKRILSALPPARREDFLNALNLIVAQMGANANPNRKSR